MPCGSFYSKFVFFVASGHNITTCNMSKSPGTPSLSGTTICNDINSAYDQPEPTVPPASNTLSQSCIAAKDFAPIKKKFSFNDGASTRGIYEGKVPLPPSEPRKHEL